MVDLSKLKSIDTFIFDIDGVLTDGMVTILPNGDQVRNMNIKDGYALQFAVKQGYKVAAISGGKSKSVLLRLQGLGVKDVHLSIENKIKQFHEYVEANNLNVDNILYMGDDIPDLEVMRETGFAACPKDAAHEIREVSNFISGKKGGEGCVRDIIEQTMRIQGKWLNGNAYEW